MSAKPSALSADTVWQDLAPISLQGNDTDRSAGGPTPDAIAPDAPIVEAQQGLRMAR